MQDGSLEYVIVESFVCFTSTAPANLRLMNGADERSGRVEIYHKGEWGTVCDNNFGKEEARVICKALGYG